MLSKKLMLISLLSLPAVELSASQWQSKALYTAGGVVGTWVACHLLYTSSHAKQMNVAKAGYDKKAAMFQEQLDKFSTRIIELEQDKKKLQNQQEDTTKSTQALETQIVELKKERDMYVVKLQKHEEQTSRK